jgi:hypothetical protein
MVPSGMLRPVALVIDVSEELSASFIRVTGIGELGTTLAVTSNRRTLRRNTKQFLRSVRRLLVTGSVVPSSPILVTLFQGGAKFRVLQEPHGVTSQKTSLFNLVACPLPLLVMAQYVIFQLGFPLLGILFAEFFFIF